METNDRIDTQVEKALTREIKHLASKDDLHSLETKLIYWMVGMLVTMLLGFIVTLVTLMPPKQAGYAQPVQTGQPLE